MFPDESSGPGQAPSIPLPGGTGYPGAAYPGSPYPGTGHPGAGYPAPGPAARPHDDRDVDPDLSNAARALAAFVASRHRDPAVAGPDQAPPDDDPDNDLHDDPDDDPDGGGHDEGPDDDDRDGRGHADGHGDGGHDDGGHEAGRTSDRPGAGSGEEAGYDGPHHEPGYDHGLTFGGTPAARVALVTGAGRGIGRAIALGLGRAGLNVALLGRSPDALEEVAAEIASFGVGASWAGADVRDFAQVQNAVERLEAALGEIDLLVNNAGVIEPVEVPVWDAGPETWWHVVETDLRGPFHCVRAVVPGMVERGGGRVVNLSSGTGAGDRDVYSAYAAAKAGLFRITGSLHLAGYERGVRAFEISPGVVRTDMTTAMAVHAGRQDWTPVEKVVELVVAAAGGRLDAWSGSFLRAGVDSLEALDAAELKAGENGLPVMARRLGILPYGPTDPLAARNRG